MYNTDLPTRAELPTSEQLIRSTIIAVISAVIILVIVVLPSEYSIDPTGIGRTLGLTQMGEIKTQLAAEAASDKEALVMASQGTASAVNSKPQVPAVASSATFQLRQVPAVSASSGWRDETSFTLSPGQGIEVKMKMRQGTKAQYSWISQGGPVNFDTHGDSSENSISYEKGRGVPSDEGELEAAFDGNHGWFWRNRGKRKSRFTYGLVVNIWK